MAVEVMHGPRFTPSRPGSLGKRRAELQRDEKHLLICAVQREALEALTQSLQSHGVSLHSVQPHFCATW